MHSELGFRSEPADGAAHDVDDADEPLGRGVSVVVPAYRSSNSLPELHARVVAVMERLGIDYEIIFVEDCGGDETFTVIADLAGADAHVRGFQLARNFGQHNALLCGIRAARMDVIVTLDDDLQNPPEEIPKLLDALAQGCDVIYGTPEREQHGFLRDMASRVTKMALQSVMGAATARKVSAFRAFRTVARRGFERYRSPFVSIDVLLTWGAGRFGSVPVRHAARVGGESGYTLRKLITHALNMMTGFSTLPLQIASMVGFTFTVLGMAVLAYVVARYLIEGGSVPGFPFLASIIALFSGAQLFALGIIGEYLARMHFRTMERPPYVVSERVGATTASPLSRDSGVLAANTRP
jgi:undecaprenyl-phosphate 4-deoxy-4-formamido-L-arabinose transferase